MLALFPAYAGVILNLEYLAEMRVTFPRIRGGDPFKKAEQRGATLLFPAYAGVIRNGERWESISKTFPRIRGGDPDVHAVFCVSLVFSPHTRG